jgi:hypothetical protein
VTVPAHAYLNAAGSDWDCERGYERAGGRCDALTLPRNAYLDYSGSDWRCESGFRKQGAVCAPESVR